MSTPAVTAGSSAAAPPAGPPRPVTWVRGIPDVVTVLVWYVLTRVWGAVLIHRAAADQLPTAWTGQWASYTEMSQLWDGQWYKIIAEQGYPLPLPTDQFGVVQQNPWAFFPGFPALVGSVMAVTGLPYAVAAIVSNVTLGAAAMVVIWRVLRLVTSDRVAVGGTMLVAAFPSAPVLQIAYSESSALLLLALATLFLVQRRYGWCAVLVVLLGLTRPVLAPFTVVVVAHALARYRASHGVWGWGERPREKFPMAEQVRVILLGVGVVGASVLWPAMVGMFVGSADAYERTQAAWRSGGVGWPFEQAWRTAQVLWGERGHWWLVAAGVVVVVVALSRWSRRLGPELATWTAVYPVYLVALSGLGTSMFRYLLLTFPWGAIVAGLLRWRLLVLLVAGFGLWGQSVWVSELLVLRPPTDFPP